MSQDLTANSVRQMPQVTSPDLLHMKIIDKLIANCLDQTANPFTKPQLLWTQLRRLSILGRHRKLKSLMLKKLLLQRLRKISSIGQKQTSVTFGQFLNHTDVMDVGGGKVKGLNHADRVNLHMEPKTIKGLIAKLFAIVGYALKEFRASGSGEPANSHREAVKYKDGVSQSFGDVFEQPLLDRPELCRLPSESNSATELWEVMPVKPFEESKDIFVGIEAEDFADDFHCKYFTVSHLWHWTSAPKCSFWEIFFHKIISFTEDIYDKIIKVHFFALHGQRNSNLFLSSIDQRAFFVLVLG